MQVFGNDHAVAFAGSQGNFQLNVYKPVILHNVLESIQLLAEASRSFNDRCAVGIEPNEKRIREHLDNSLMLVTALNPHIGYEKAAQISLKAYREDLSLREAALALGFVTAEQFDEWVRPEDMRLREGGADLPQGVPRGSHPREAALGLGFVTAEQFDEWVRPEDMTHPLSTK